MFLIKRTTDKKYASSQCIKQAPTKGTALQIFAANYTNPV